MFGQAWHAQRDMVLADCQHHSRSFCMQGSLHLTLRAACQPVSHVPLEQAKQPLRTCTGTRRRRRSASRQLEMWPVRVLSYRRVRTLQIQNLVSSCIECRLSQAISQHADDLSISSPSRLVGSQRAAAWHVIILLSAATATSARACTNLSNLLLWQPECQELAPQCQQF